MKQVFGFSLIELLVTIAIVSLLAILAVPPMTAFLKNQKTQMVGSSVASALRFARSAAMEHQMLVGVCLSSNNQNTACDSTWNENGSNQRNLIVFLDANSDGQFQSNGSDTILKIFSGPSPDSIQFNLSNNIVHGILSFNAFGFYKLTAESTVTVTPKSGCTGKSAQKITISPTGNISLTQVACNS